MFSTAEALKARGLRATPQRIGILKELVVRKDHPSVDMVYRQSKEKFPTISLNTVYTTLLAMEKVGLIRRIDAGDGLVRYDGNPLPHAHIVCTVCQRVDDVDLKVESDISGKTLMDHAKRASDYTVFDYAIYFYGMCSDCRHQK